MDRRSGPVRVLLLNGSTRAASTNGAVLRTVPDVAPPEVEPVLYAGLADLPAFDPDRDTDPLPRAVAALREEVGRADAVLVCTPEYAGGLPGSLKNLLDWTVGDAAMQGKPFGWLNVASVAAPTGGAGAHAALATVLGYVGADLVAGACLRAPMTRAAVGEDGRVSDPGVRAALGDAVTALARHVRAERTGRLPDA